MRLLFKTGLILAVVLGLSGYAGYLLTGKLPWQALKTVTLPKLSAPSVVNAVPDAIKAQQDTIYKWRDEHGQWHFSSEAPSPSIQADQVLIDPNQNVMVSTPLPKDSAPEPVDGNQAAEPEEQPFLYSPEGVKQVMDKAHEAQKQMQERAAQQQKILNQL